MKIKLFYCFLICFTFFSCKKESAVELLLKSNKKNTKIWTIVEENYTNIDTFNLPNALIFKKDEVLESFSIENGVKYHEISLDKNNDVKPNWNYNESNNVLRIGNFDFKIAQKGNNYLLLKPLSKDIKGKKILIKVISFNTKSNP